MPLCKLLDHVGINISIGFDEYGFVGMDIESEITFVEVDILRGRVSPSALPFILLSSVLEFSSICCHQYIDLIAPLDHISCRSDFAIDSWAKGLEQATIWEGRPTIMHLCEACAEAVIQHDI
jgi:hypothetical protein